MYNLKRCAMSHKTRDYQRLGSRVFVSSVREDSFPLCDFVAIVDPSFHPARVVSVSGHVSPRCSSGMYTHEHYRFMQVLDLMLNGDGVPETYLFAD